jgi:hypothetical protein
MTPGMVIEAKTHFGDIKIEANNKLTRTYSWNSVQKQFSLGARWQRWHGSKGIIRPSGDKDMHAVLEEGQQHFYSVEEALAWLAWQMERMKWVYTSDGLVVGWYEAKDKKSRDTALLVEVWQIYIQGKKPESLPGATDDKITITFNGSITYPEIGNVTPRAPEMIEGRWYTGMALDYMDQEKTSPDIVETVIKKANKRQKGEYFWYYGWGLDPSMPHLSVCTNTKGKVMLVVG